jgi:hypothetical protein
VLVANPACIFEPAHMSESNCAFEISLAIHTSFSCTSWWLAIG